MFYRAIDKDDLDGFFEIKPNAFPSKLLDAIDEINNIFSKFQQSKNDNSINKIELHTQYHSLIDGFKRLLISSAVELKIHLTKDMGALILDHSGSFLRGKYLLDLRQTLSKDDWMELFFENWSMIEIGDALIEDLKEIFKDADFPALMKKYATENSYKHYLEMPDTLNVMRGCSTNSIDGLSWTTDIEIAKFFASRRFDLFNRSGMMKFRILSDIHNKEDQDLFMNLPHEDTYIVFGEVSKEDCLFFADRGELEIFSPKVTITDSEEFHTAQEIEYFEL